MTKRSLLYFIKQFEASKELIRITTPVSTDLEITEIVDRVVKSEKQNKALLFENNGTKFPLLINLFGNEKRTASIMGVSSLEEITKNIETLLDSLKIKQPSFLDKLKILSRLKIFASWMPKTLSDKGLCQQNVMKAPNLLEFPILKCWPADGGKFITLPLVHTKDLETGNRNLGMYRMQVFDKQTTGMHWHIHKGGATHFDKYKKLKKKMPVAVALGGDPIYNYVATAPLPEDIDEYILAGFLRKKRVELVKCLTQDIEVPADSDIVIEGFIDPEENPIIEGPFGDHTGFYSLPDRYPVFHITAITYKNKAIYPSTIVGIPPQEDAWLGKTTERLFLPLIKQTLLPEIVDMNLPFAGVAHNLAIVSIKKRFSGQAMKTAHALWGAGQMMFNKIMIVVNENIDVNNYEQVANTIYNHCDFSKDIYFSSGNLDVLDHAARQKVFGGKLLIDATNKKNENLNDSKIQIDKDMVLFFQNKVLVIYVESLTESISLLWENIKKKNNLNGIHLVIFSDVHITKNDTNFLVWLTLSNIDISEDVLHDKEMRILIFDARNKPQIGTPLGKWPRMLINHPDIIKSVDNKWYSLGIGPFIESPSLKLLNKVPFSNSYFFEKPKLI